MAVIPFRGASVKINFTKEQYETLIKAVYLGNWVVNATDAEAVDESFDALEEYILSFAKDFGLEKYVDYDEGEQKFYASCEFEGGDVEEHIQRYDDSTFWEKLIFNLAERDLVHKYGERALEKMDDAERFGKEQEFLEKYEQEFSRNGIGNLVIKSKVKSQR
jgi:hypothetical protein